MGKKISTQKEAQAWADANKDAKVSMLINGYMAVPHTSRYFSYDNSIKTYFTAINGSIVALPDVDCVEPKKREMTDAEVFKALSGGAVLRLYGCHTTSNSWSSEYDPKAQEICYDYTGTDDVWEKLEVVDG